MKQKNKYHKTIFNGILAKPLHYFSVFVLKLLGWTIENDISQRYRKAIIIGAPHTTNWDFFYGIMFAFAIRLQNLYILGKDSLVKPPFGFIIKWLSVIPVNRSNSQNAVGKIVELFNSLDHIVIGLTPEGTRKRVSKWRTGFYYIANEAKVPILMAYIDYKKRVVGFISEFQPGGNIEEDIAKIRAAYSQKCESSKGW